MIEAVLNAESSQKQYKGSYTGTIMLHRSNHSEISKHDFMGDYNAKVTETSMQVF